MANNRILLYCKHCLEYTAIAKYYPIAWYSFKETGSMMDEFFNDHQERCFSDGTNVDDAQEGTGMFGLRTEADEDGFIMDRPNDKPYRLIRIP